MKRLKLGVILLGMMGGLAAAHAQTTAFTYQGRLNDGANPANGKYDLTFALFSVVSGAGQVGITLTNSTTGVSNGLFTVTLDFGNQFPGANRWLEIAVRTNGGGAFTALAPRQPLTPAPYAIYAANAAQVGGQGATAFVAKAGDTMTGPLNLPANGLTVGTSQLVASGGKVTLGGALVVDNLDLNSGVFNPGLTFGFGSGEGIASKRNSGGNQFGLDLYTAGLTRLSIAFGGNVGIGTTTPAARLDVNGTVNASGLLSAPAGVRVDRTNVWFTGDQNHGVGWYGAGRTFAFAAPDGPVLFGFNGGALGTEQSGTERMALFWNNAGNVGIGTVSPDRPLVVQANGSSELISLKDNTGANRWHLNLQSGGLNFAQSAVADGRLFLGTNGNVGIGTLAPVSALQVVGTVTADNFIATAGPATPPGMVLIPAGSFTMGNSIGDGDITDATPISVTVSAFYLDMNLVTLSQWQSVYFWATNHGYSFVNAGAGKAANHPVQSVDWYDTVKWSNARSEQAGKTPMYYTDAGLTLVYATGEPATLYPNWAASGYRLPTEAEWEKAARGGLSGQRFPWGNVINQNLANYYGDTASYSYDLGPNGYNPIGSIGETSPATSPVGAFAANGYGLNDMAGNVFEWCWDWYGTPYAGGSDPHGPVGPLSDRVLRGGNWSDPAKYARCADRYHLPPYYTNNDYGFRCVRGL